MKNKLIWQGVVSELMQGPTCRIVLMSEDPIRVYVETQEGTAMMGEPVWKHASNVNVVNIVLAYAAVSLQKRLESAE